MVGLMLAGSLVLHGGLVGIASLWKSPQPDDHSVIVDIFDGPTESPGPSKTFESPPQGPPETPVATATPEAIIDTVPTPPPVEKDTEFAEPSVQSPPPRRQPTVVRSTTPTDRPTITQATSRSSTGPAGGGTPGNGPAMSGSSSWVMPHPPYPRVRGISSSSGQTTVRITTDAAGRISNVVIVKSTGNPVLDNHTLSYVRNNWRGPANASRTTEFVYELR